MEGYIVSLIIFTAVFALFSLGLNLQWGFTGLLNFGQVAFMLVSAYIVVILTKDDYLKERPMELLETFRWMRENSAIAQFLQNLSDLLPSHVSMPIAVGVGAIAAALLGLLMGLATLKLRTDYLAIVTIGTAEVLRSVALNEEWLTEGTQGIQGVSVPLANLEPNYVVRLLLILSFTGIVGTGYYTLWRWLQRTVKAVPLPTLARSSAAVGLYGLIAMGGLWGMGAIARHLNTHDHFPAWLVGAFPFVALGLTGVGLVWLAQRYRTKLPALTESIAVVSTIVITGLGLWVYGYATSALYHYDRNPTKTGLMWLSVMAVALVFWALERLVRSPWGRVLKAIREDEDVACALGKNVFWYKIQSLMLGGIITGLSGAFYVWQLTTIYPDNFKPIATFNGWTIVILGGAGSNVGTLLGATLFWTYQTLSRFLLDDILPVSDAKIGAIRIMLIGLLLIVLMMWRPQGILGNRDELTLNR